MNLLKLSACMMLLSSLLCSHTFAQDNARVLPTIVVMSESEMRSQDGFIPYQEDQKVRQALQHKVYKINNELQSTGAMKVATNIVAPVASPTVDMRQVSPALEQYILSVATGFQSSDPTNGVFNMLQPLNINRSNIDGLRRGTLEIDINDLIRLQNAIQLGISRK